MTDELLRNTQIMFHIESGYACHAFFEYKRAFEHFATAKKLAGLEIVLTGAMGKRTRYQEEDKAQLVLKVSREGENGNCDVNFLKSSSLPKDLPLNDDTVLNDIKFADDSIADSVQLTPLEQALVIGLMESYRRSRANDRLTDEEISAYLTYVLSRVTNWCVSVVALYLRSRLERDSRRRVERSMMQLEELAKVVGTDESGADIGCRMPLFYAANLPPIWRLQKELANLLLSLGCIGEALNIFERLEMWEDVISCYQKLGKRERAEAVIRERLAIKETPSLLCFLGDVTRNIEHYQQAWELSNHKSARAMRCMGYIYFHEEKYQKAVECFATSLKINSLQIPVWFTYGCASMACQNFEVGVKAFKRCVNIDFDNFEAWSNLATCYVRLKQKKKAYATLQDALKCNYENWRLWENNLVIGTDCGEFEDVIRSYHRLLDLREKWIDKEVLSILTRAVLEKIPDADGRPGDRLAGKVCELFGRVTSKTTSEGDIWADYAKLTSIKIGEKEPEPEKALQYLQKSHRCYTQKVDWEKDVDMCKKVAEQALNLAQAHILCSAGKTQQESLQNLAAAKLMLNGTLVKIQKQHTDPITKELLLEVKEKCQEMEDKLTEIVAQITNLRNS
ncbi:tetratricopeptide repeat protein 27-like isoform X2 [Physella acuta]|nr:tetratricopeptide repeat protein 27-like isoform X2 [Physella acuta]